MVFSKERHCPNAFSIIFSSIETFALSFFSVFSQLKGLIFFSNFCSIRNAL